MRRNRALRLIAVGLSVLAGSALAQDEHDDFDILLDGLPSEPVERTNEPAPDDPPPPVVPVESSPEAAPEVPPAARGRIGIEELVVTAQRREQMLQDVPITIDVFTGDELDAKGIFEPSKLQYSTPGLIYDELANFAIIYLRGVGTDAFIPSADLSIATYIDGVAFPYSFNLARALGSVERIEVIKGPQGTLFGRNATGGAINVITRQPTDHWTGEIQQSFGSFSERNTRFLLSGPLTDSLSANIGVIYNRADEYYELSDDAPLDRLPSRRERGINAKLRWAPSPVFDTTLSAFVIEGQGTGSALFVQENPSTLGTLLGLRAEEEDWATSVNERASFSSEVVAASLTGELRLHPFDIKSISAYQEFEGHQIVDFDGTSVSLVSFGNLPPQEGMRPGAFGRAFTQELQLLSNDNGWLSSANIEWVLGAYYLTGSTGFPNTDFGVSQLSSLFEFSGGLPGIPPALGLINDLLEGVFAPLTPLLPQAAILLTVRGEVETESVSAFTQATWTPLHWLDLTAGARVQREKRKVLNSGLAAALVVNDNRAEVPVFTWAEDSLQETNVSPRIALSVRPFTDTTLFVSATQGFKSGSFNIINLTAPPSAIRPETVTAYEVGVRSNLFDRRLRVNAALFRNEIKDLQSQFLSFFSGGVVQFQNAEEAVINGIDLAIRWAITQDLVLDVGGTWLDGTYARFTEASGFDPNTGLLTTDNDFSGNRIVRNPEYTVASSLNYFLNAPGGNIELGVDYYYNDGFYYDAQNVTEQPSYYTLGARISYLHQRSNIRITGFGDNINRARRFSYKFPNDFGVVSKLGTPDLYGVRLSWSF